MGFPEVWQRGSQVALSLTVSMIVLVLCRSVAVTQETKPPGVPTLPAHVLNDPELFDRTMAHIGDDDLIAALNLDRPELEAVKEASGKNTKLALKALGAHMERRDRPVDVVNAATYRDELRSYHKAFPNKSDSLVRLFNAMHEWSLAIRGRQLVRALHHMAATQSFDVQTQTRMLKTILGSCRRPGETARDRGESAPRQVRIT